jgi:hypothetical protein
MAESGGWEKEGLSGRAARIIDILRRPDEDFSQTVWWTYRLSLIDFQVLPGYHEPQDQERGGFHADAHTDASRAGDRDRP